ncbi:MAG: molecular chaperone [Pyrinomonadaceae bacterium]|nr:molecular chaperone [Sphingobacteriaceae bacterium]
MTHKIFNLLLVFCLLTSISKAQSISVSPSRFYYKVNPGGIKSQILKVTNNSTAKESFVITFGDFAAPGTQGKSVLMKPGESPNSLVKNISANPSFFELEPGKSQDVQVILEMPNLPESNKVKWGTLMLKIEKEKKSAKGATNSDVGMGILETFQFIVHVFQTPPNVTYKKAEIVSFQEVVGDQPTAGRVVAISTKNTGEAILDCASYIEYVHLRTGKQVRLKPSAFTVLPGGAREVKFILPTDLEKGKYNLTGVVDYGSKEEVQAAEMEIEIK